MSTSSVLDVDSFHALLALRAGKNGTLRIVQSKYAKELRTTRLVVHRVIQNMVGQGRIVELPGATGPASRTYRIIAPQVWLAQHSS